MTSGTAAGLWFIAIGAESASRRSLGTAVFGGMVTLPVKDIHG